MRITEPDLAEINTAIATLKAKPLPQLKPLSVQDRLELPKMGDKTVAFVQKANDYARKNASFVPVFLDTAAMGVDLTAVQTLRESRGTSPPSKRPWTTASRSPAAKPTRQPSSSTRTSG